MAAGLSGKVVLVAGAASGIGAATAERLALEGATVAVADIAFDGAQATAARIVSAGGTASAFEYDQASESSIATLTQEVGRTLGPIHGLHANAADLSEQTLGRDLNLLKMDVDVWMRTLSVNLVGAAVLARGVLPQMIERGEGAIVMTSSAMSAQGAPTNPAYSASKAGVNTLIRHIATKWGKHGVRANAVAPGLVLSEVVEARMEDWFREKNMSEHRSKRLGRPEDIAGAVAFLMSDDGAWVNGQVWGVNGGLVLRD